jgi:hypothetical protein
VKPARRAAVIVWLVWALTLASVLVAIAREGRNIPFEEDWLMVAAMTGHQPDLPSWLWSQNSEHRLPLPRLVNLALLRATGDFRSTMFFDAMALGAMAAAMILVARALRGGQTSLTDVFFPLLLLHLGNWDNLLWAWQIQFVLPTVLACVLLLIVVTRPTPPTGWAEAIGAVALLSLPLSGANGLVFTPTLAAWMGYSGWVQRQDRPDRGSHGWVSIGAALGALVLCAVYFSGYQASPWNESSPGLAATLATSGKFLALSVGPAAANGWLVCGVLVGLAFLISLSLLITSHRDQRSERLRILGLLAFFTAALVLALAVGWGRAGRAAETGRMPTRYVLLAAPGLCAAYLTALLFGRSWTRGLAAALAALLALLFPLNTHVGWERRAWFGAGFTAFERDLAADLSPSLLARRHYPFMLHWDESLMVVSLQQLHDAGIGLFEKWQPEPARHPAMAEPRRVAPHSH